MCKSSDLGFSVISRTFTKVLFYLLEIDCPFKTILLWLVDSYLMISLKSHFELRLSPVGSELGKIDTRVIYNLEAYQASSSV